MKTAETSSVPSRPYRIGLVLPVRYRGGSLRGTKLLAEAITLGSRQAAEPADVVIFYVDEDLDEDGEFRRLPLNVSARPYRLLTITAAQARDAMRYAGHPAWRPSTPTYSVVEDGIRSAADCDVIIVISNRLLAPLLPLRPTLIMQYDFLQRYFRLWDDSAENRFLQNLHLADGILVTTDFAARDGRQYAGLPGDKIFRVPMLAPTMAAEVKRPEPGSYFVWTTNAAPHKNHLNAIKALETYYARLGGSLQCVITGADTSSIRSSELPHLKEVGQRLKRNQVLADNLLFRGDLPDSEYRTELMRAAFLWHAGQLDNGTFSVVEAAQLGVPALSSDYPAMREMDQQFSLGLNFVSPFDPDAIAAALKKMESDHSALRLGLPSPAVFRENAVERLAPEYWSVIRSFTR